MGENEYQINDQEAASRALDDPEFAQKVLTGEVNLPSVRNAILADLYQSSAESEPDDAGFAVFQNRTVDIGPSAGPMGPCYVRYYPKMPAIEMWQEWRTLSKPNLIALARGRQQDV